MPRFPRRPLSTDARPGPSAADAAGRRPPPLAARLPAFPWDSLAPAAALARTHPDGIVDLSVGTPVDPVPATVRQALAQAANSPGYPPTIGTAALRAAASGWLARRHQVIVPDEAVLPVIGTKEFIASLPGLLGCGPSQTVGHPELGYPTYDIGARMAGARSVATDWPDRPGADPLALAWINSPANPTGQVLAPDRLADLVRWARSAGTVLASDECYLDLGFEADPVSILHPDVCGSSHHGLLAVFSLSKRSNMAGYRAGFVAGDPDLIAALSAVRKHAGMMMPAPVQAAMAAALDDDAHAEQQHAVYARRRAVLRPALERAGWAVSHSQAGLYMWAAHPDRDCWQSVQALAEIGILVSPGAFYGPAGSGHVRVALTATDERIGAAARRLAEAG